jgi:hypothetical protein
MSMLNAMPRSPLYSGGGDDDADEFGKRAEIGGEGWQDRASCHLIAEAR